MIQKLLTDLLIVERLGVGGLRSKERHEQASGFRRRFHGGIAGSNKTVVLKRSGIILIFSALVPFLYVARAT